MKHVIILISAVMLVSCKKEGNKSVIASENSAEVVNNNGTIDSTSTSSSTSNVDGKIDKSESFTYKGLEGTRAKATFDTKNGEQTITIQANNNKFQLDLIEDTPEKKIYERRGIRAEVMGDSINIIQDKNVIPLVKAK